MQTPPGNGGAWQNGTDTGVIDPPHICPSPAVLSTPKAKYSPSYIGEINGGCVQHLNEAGEDGTDLIWSRMGLEVTPASGTMRARPPSFVMVRIKVLDERTFRPKKKGQWAATVGVNNRDSQLIDVCAFFLHDIHHWWLRRRSQTPVLGADQIDYASFYRQPLTLYQTPYDWLLGRGNGAVVLDWGCDLRDVFEGIPKIQCRSITLGKRLRQSYTKFQPTITGPVKRKRHGA